MYWFLLLRLAQPTSKLGYLTYLNIRVSLKAALILEEEENYAIFTPDSDIHLSPISL